MNEGETQWQNLHQKCCENEESNNECEDEKKMKGKKKKKKKTGLWNTFFFAEHSLRITPFGDGKTEQRIVTVTC